MATDTKQNDGQLSDEQRQSLEDMRRRIRDTQRYVDESNKRVDKATAAAGKMGRHNEKNANVIRRQGDRYGNAVNALPNYGSYAQVHPHDEAIDREIEELRRQESTSPSLNQHPTMHSDRTDSELHPELERDLQAHEGHEIAGSHTGDHQALWGLPKANREYTSNKQALDNLQDGKNTPGLTPRESRAKGAVGFLAGRGFLSGLASPKKKKKKLLIAGLLGSGALLIVLVLLLFFTFFGSLKVVHFATVLRSVGFARYQLYMRDQYAKTIFDAATLTTNSTGRAYEQLGDRSLVQKLLRINPQARLQQLGDEGALKFDFQTQNSKWLGPLKKTNQFKGVVVDGNQRIYLDDISQQLFGANYDSLLNPISKLRVQAQFLSEAKVALNDRLATEGMSFRSSIYMGLRQLAGIRMFVWTADLLNKLFNGKTNEDISTEVNNDASYVDNGTTTIPTGEDQIDQSATQANQANVADGIKAAETGKVETSPLMQRLVPLAEKLKPIDNISSVAFLATVACVAHSLAGSISQAQQQNEVKALRLGHDALTVSNQIQQGADQGQNVVNAQAVGAEGAIWDNADQAVLYKQATGVPLGTADYQQFGQIPYVTGALGALGIAANLVNSIFNTAVFTTNPILSILAGGPNALSTQICNVILNQYAQFGLAGVEIVAAVLSAGTAEEAAFSVRAALTAAFWGLAKFGVTIGVGQLVGYLIDQAVATAANVDYSGADTGPLRYNESAIGIDEFEQTANRQMTFGKPLTADETASQQLVAMNAQITTNSQQSFSQRYFAIDNPYSLLGRISAVVPTSFSDITADMRMGFASLTGIFQPLRMVGSLMNAFEPQALAATSGQSYLTGALKGVNEWGWTAQEENEFTTDTNYSWQANVLAVEPQFDALSQKYDPCYSPTSFNNGAPDIPSQCTEQFLSTPEALHWRMYMREGYAAPHVTPGNTDQ
ncbi:MAG TPA: hypothetical protein VGS08_01890 [Candidatus Saccharimonadales bacterium]|nr:hypothetical protein [Candidatus Saccharimonadales bacterium]